jgi:transcriptional regulator with XRE-family HTH domain
MLKRKSDSPRYPDDAADMKELLAPLKGMKREAIAEAVGVSASTLSKIARGKQQLRYQLAKKLLALVREMRPLGFAEASSDFQLKGEQTLRTIPEYACRALPDGEWRIEISTPLRHRRIELREQSSFEAFAIQAPDNAAAPRHKKGELIVFDRGVTPGIGDDAFLWRRENESVLSGLFGELLRGSATHYRLRLYSAIEAPLDLDLENWDAFISFSLR